MGGKCSRLWIILLLFRNLKGFRSRLFRTISHPNPVFWDPTPR